MRVIGYTRVSSNGQAESGLGLEAQEAAIRLACEQRGWQLVGFRSDGGASGGSLKKRPELETAMRECEAGQADALVVAKLDRLARSVVDFGTILARAKRKGWNVVMLDLGVDTSTAAGQMVTNVLSVFAEFERQLVSERTKAALAAKVAKGERLGRPSQFTPAVRARARQLRAERKSLVVIASTLEAEGFTTPTGKRRWGATQVVRALK